MYIYNAVGNSSSQVSSPLTDSEMSITNSNSMPRSVGTKLTCSPAAPMTPEELAEESQRKRDIRLRKNRYRVVCDKHHRFHRYRRHKFRIFSPGAISY